MMQNRSKMKLTTAIVIVAFSALSLCSGANADIGLGIAPSSITVSNALRGGTFERTITVFNTGDEPGNFALTAQGECADWISFSEEANPDIQITEVTIQGNSKVRILVKFNIPPEIPDGNYTSTIFAQSIPKGNITEGIGAVTAIRIPSTVLIQVTGTQILKGEVKSIKTEDTEVGYPLKIRVVFRNEGNVIANPRIAVAIIKDGGLVDSFVHAETGIKPDSEETITVQWNTTGRETGDYIATVNVSLGAELLASQSLQFTILPVGTLTRRGDLKELRIEGEPLVNRVVKIVAVFGNTGEIDTTAKLKGELYKGAALIDYIESDELLVEVGTDAELPSYYKITEPGNYSVKGRVLYSGKETEEKEISFNVPAVETGIPGKKGIPGFELALALISIVVVSFSLKMKKRR